MGVQHYWEWLGVEQLGINSAENFLSLNITTSWISQETEIRKYNIEIKFLMGLNKNKELGGRNSLLRVERKRNKVVN